MKRDMSEREFREAMQRHCFGEIGPFGYVALPSAPDRRVSVLNAGPRLRDILAYLIREDAKAAPVNAP